MISRKPRVSSIAGLVSQIILAFTLFSDSPVAEAQNRTWRPVVMANHGMVASGHPLASMVGMQILMEGGNAVDAAVGTWAAQGLVEPQMTGLGGDAFILIYLAKTGEVKFINGTGPAPQRATLDFYKERGGIPQEGALASDVPGALDGIGIALEKYGTQTYKQVLEPAIELAERGHPVSYVLAGVLESNRETLSRFPSTTALWFRDGRPLRAGEIVVQKGYGETLKKIAAGGRRIFYKGEVARTTADFMSKQGGLLNADDLSNYHAHEAEPIHVNYRGYEVYEAAPNSQGHVLLQALNILEGFPLKYMGHNSAPYLHLITEALKLSFADRDRYLGDPRFVPPIPMEGLLAKEYAASRRALINPERAMTGPVPAGVPGTETSDQEGNSRPGYARAAAMLDRPIAQDIGTGDDALVGSTTYLAVIDKEHNMVSITSSLCSSFGSGLIMGENGFFMNNRMVYYFLEPDHPNVLVPGKRTRHTINPALVLKDGKPFMAFGTPGGDTQPQTELQFFLNLIDFGMNVQQALEAPAVISSYFQSSFWPHETANKLRVPLALPEPVRARLAAMGHDLDVGDYRGVGAVKAVLIDPASGALMGGVSPMGDSYVIGW
jgi:gamma-glutamyltranspeptidase/glutathione hydrolase